MKKIWIVLLVSLLVSLACSFTQNVTIPGQDAPPTPPTSQPATAAPQPPTQPAAPPSATPVSGIPISYKNAAFTIPLEMNASATPSTTTDVEFPYINPSGGPMPEHLVFLVTNYPVEGDAKIMIFKSSDFASYGPPSQNVITALLGKQDGAQPLPPALAQDFYAQAKTISFKNGHGVRYLTQVLTNFAPVTNRDLFYYFQGVTNDGASFVSAILHVSAPFLVADGNSNSPTPPGGVPFGAPDMDFKKYLGDITQKLNDAAPESYTVNLALLDQLVESIQVNP